MVNSTSPRFQGRIYIIGQRKNTSPICRTWGCKNQQGAQQKIKYSCVEHGDTISLQDFLRTYCPIIFQVLVEAVRLHLGRR